MNMTTNLEVPKQKETSEVPKAEVKKPGLWDKFLDKFGKGKRWEKEVAYLESKDQIEVPAENEQAGEMLKDVQTDVEDTMVDSAVQDGKAIDALQVEIEALGGDDELSTEAQALKEEVNLASKKAMGSLAEYKIFSGTVEDGKVTAEKTTTANINIAPEPRRVPPKEVPGTHMLVHPKNPGEGPEGTNFVFEVNGQDPQYFVTYEEAKATLENFGKTPVETVQATNARESEPVQNKRIISPEVSESLRIQNEQRNKIKDVLVESGIQLPEDDEDRYAEGIREKINEWNVADSKDHFQDPNQIKEAFKQVHEQIVKDDEGYARKQEEKNKSFNTNQATSKEKTPSDNSGNVESVIKPRKKEGPEVENEQINEIKERVKNLTQEIQTKLEDVFLNGESIKHKFDKIVTSLENLSGDEIKGIKNLNLFLNELDNVEDGLDIIIKNIRKGYLTDGEELNRAVNLMEKNLSIVTTENKQEFKQKDIPPPLTVEVRQKGSDDGEDSVLENNGKGANDSEESVASGEKNGEYGDGSVGDTNENKEFSNIEKEQIQKIKNIIKETFPKEENFSGVTAKKIKDLINEQNIKDSVDYFGNKEKTIDAYNQVLEAEHPVVAEQIKNIADILKEEETDGVSNKVLHDVRRKINDWNVTDAKNHFEDPNQIKEAYKQIKENSNQILFL